MKKIKEYRINEGLDGVIFAKSLKHAVKQLIGQQMRENIVRKVYLKNQKFWVGANISS